MRKLIVLLAILIVFLAGWSAFSIYFPQAIENLNLRSEPREEVKIISEESVTIEAVEKVGPSVVTIVQKSSSDESRIQIGPFYFFEVPQQEESVSIGSGFIVSDSGLVVTNKHVVSDEADYQVVNSNDNKYDVKDIYRDPMNDIAILKIDPSQNPGQELTEVSLGDSSDLQVGQFVIAIGTALGEFRNTVTTGVISGLGRGITAGDIFQGYVEELDNVIQTDAAINPGNSGGPLLNSSSQVIGVNTAIASQGENIGFALPVNVVKDSLKNFNEGGQFDRAYLGVSYKMINRDLALLNEVPQGAYVDSIVKDSPAEESGVERGDIITSFDGKDINGAEDELSELIAKKRPGDEVVLKIWRNGKEEDLKTKLVTIP